MGCKNYRETERMVFLGLAGSPPIQIGEGWDYLWVEIKQTEILRFGEL